MSESKIMALTASHERPAATASGYVMLLLLLLVVAVQVFGIVSLANDRDGLLPILAVVLGPIGLLLIAPGFYMLQPN